MSFLRILTVSLQMLLFTAGTLPYADAASMLVSLRGNPIRRVVTMLQNMQSKISEESKTEEANFHKFMCYCETNKQSLRTSVEGATDKVPQIDSEISSMTHAKAQLTSHLADAKTSREDAMKAITISMALREKQEAEFNKESASMSSDIQALNKAIPALENGLSSAFLQTRTASLLRRLSNTVDMNIGDREMLASFLAGGERTPQSAEIVGIMEQIREEIQHALAELKSQEAERVTLYESLVEAKKKEIAAITKVIEAKTVREGELAVKIAETTNDLEDTNEGLATDKKFLSDLDKDCKTKAADFEKFKSAQAEELKAIADTITYLNDDDALDLFKKTLPSPASFLQLQVSPASVRKQALHELKIRHAHRAGTGDPRVDFIELALRGRTKGFDKIITLIDGLIETLGREQKDDDEQKEYCNKKLEDNADLAKEQSISISDVTKAIASVEEDITKKKSETAALSEKVKQLDAQVVDATESRKQEHSAHVKMLAENNAAQDLLEFAKNRLNKYYNPTLYVTPKPQELTDDERIYVNYGGEITTPAPGGIANTGIDSPLFVQVHSTRSISTDIAPYKKKTEDSNGVIAMIDLLLKDLSKESTAATLTEKDAQEEYEHFVKDAQVKRAADSKSISNNMAVEAAMEELLIKHKDSLHKQKKELLETTQLISALHGECDWLLKYDKVRTQARDDEIDALGKAKDVLSGADYSFVQTKMTRQHLRGKESRDA